MHLAVVGKGGAGKSVIAATVARLLARRGREVLALDSDMLPGLTLSLGADVPAEPPLNAAAERDADGRWRLRRGIGPVRAVRRYATPAPDGVHLLQAGKTSPAEGIEPVAGAVNAFYAVIHGLRRPASFKSWAIIGDLSAGPRQTAFDWAPYADRALLVVEPTWQSVLTARRIVRIGNARRPVDALLVVNKATRAGDVQRVEDLLGLRAVGAVPADDEVRTAEREGVALLDVAPRSPAARAMEELVERLEAVTLARR